MGSAPRQRFEELARRPDRDVPLAEGALWIAAEGYPDLDVDHYLEALDRLAARAAPGVGAARGARQRAAALVAFLFDEEGFRGNQQDYYDPRNSFLNEVLDRRRGIPITLSLVWIEVATRLGLAAAGISFPGHFLTMLRVEEGEPVIADPFHGRLLDLAGCEERLRAVAGPDAVLAPGMLASAGTKQILARVLANLKQVYVARREFQQALDCSDRILLLLPDAPLELRDRGLLYQQLECFAPALRDLERFLELAPSDPSAAPVRAALAGLRARAARIS